MAISQEMINDRAILEVEDLVVTYPSKAGPLKAVDGATLKLRRGEALGLVGESGSGKTSLVLTLLRVNPTSKVTNGRIMVDGLDVLKLRGEELRRYRWEKVSMVFQSAMNSLDPVKTVASQIQETITQHLNLTKTEAKLRADRLLELVSLDPARAQSYPHELSGGMRQRVGIALALCLEPALLIADEPTTALDVVVQAGILRMLRDLHTRLGLSMILVSHDISIMSGLVDRLAVMYGGKIVETGPTREMIERPQHPYTEALLGAIPILGSKRSGIQGVPGSPPSLFNPPTGCKFHPRCKYAFARCPDDIPRLVPYGEGEVACWLRTN